MKGRRLDRMINANATEILRFYLALPTRDYIRTAEIREHRIAEVNRDLYRIRESIRRYKA